MECPGQASDLLDLFLFGQQIQGPLCPGQAQPVDGT